MNNNTKSASDTPLEETVSGDSAISAVSSLSQGRSLSLSSSSESYEKLRIFPLTPAPALQRRIEETAAQVTRMLEALPDMPAIHLSPKPYFGF
jgi:hypothetical protein